MRNVEECSAGVEVGGDASGIDDHGYAHARLSFDCDYGAGYGSAMSHVEDQRDGQYVMLLRD